MHADDAHALAGDCGLQWTDTPFVLLTGWHTCELPADHAGAHACDCGEAFAQLGTPTRQLELRADDDQAGGS
jgi:hypothetical protein